MERTSGVIPMTSIVAQESKGALCNKASSKAPLKLAYHMPCFLNRSSFFSLPTIKLLCARIGFARIKGPRSSQ